MALIRTNKASTETRDPITLGYATGSGSGLFIVNAYNGEFPRTYIKLTTATASFTITGGSAMVLDQDYELADYLTAGKFEGASPAGNHNFTFVMHD